MSRFRLASLPLLFWLLAGCSTLINGPDRAPTSSELIGVYDFGHTGFDETLELRTDGTYKRTLHGHLGQDSVTFLGTWRVIDRRVEFKPAAGQPNDSAPEPAEAFFHRHRPAFAPLRHIKADKVHDWFVYLPRSSQ